MDDQSPPVAPAEAATKREYNEGERRPEPPAGYQWSPVVVERPGNDVREYDRVYRLTRTPEKRDADWRQAKEQMAVVRAKFEDFFDSTVDRAEKLASRPKETYYKEFAQLPGAPAGFEVFTDRSYRAADAAQVDGRYVVRYCHPNSNADSTYWRLTPEQYQGLLAKAAEYGREIKQ